MRRQTELSIRYPVDCWRFYPDSGNALVTWAQRNGVNSTLLESYTSGRDANRWNDFIAVFLKDEVHANLYKDRVTSTFYDFDNAITYGNPYLMNFGVFPKGIIGRIFRRVSRRSSANEVRV